MNEYNYIIKPGDLVVTFSNISAKTSFSKNSLQWTTYHYLNGVIACFSKNVRFSSIFFYNNLLKMNIFNLVVFVVCLNPDGTSPNSGRKDDKLRDDIYINRDGKYLKIIFISHDSYLKYFLGLDINKNKIHNDDHFNELFMQTFTHKDNSLFVFKNISWAYIVDSLNKLNVQLTGGMSNRRHLTSPLSIRHHTYLLALFNYDSIALTKCVEFNNINKDWVLPRTDVTVGGKSNVQFKKDGSVVINESDENYPEFNASLCDKSVPPFTIIDESEVETTVDKNKRNKNNRNLHIDFPETHEDNVSIHLKDDFPKGAIDPSSVSPRTLEAIDNSSILPITDEEGDNLVGDKGNSYSLPRKSSGSDPLGITSNEMMVGGSVSTLGGTPGSKRSYHTIASTSPFSLRINTHFPTQL